MTLNVYQEIRRNKLIPTDVVRTGDLIGSEERCAF